MRRLGESRRWIGESLAHAVLLGDRAFRPVAAERVAVTWDELDARVRTTRPATRRPGWRRPRIGCGLLLRDRRVRRVKPTWRRCTGLRGAPVAGGLVRRPLQQVRIGDLPLVALPFEVLAELGLRVKERFPTRWSSPTRTARGLPAVPARLAAGGYEAQIGSAHFEPGTAERILDAVLRGLERC